MNNTYYNLSNDAKAVVLAAESFAAGRELSTLNPASLFYGLLCSRQSVGATALGNRGFKKGVILAITDNPRKKAVRTKKRYSEVRLGDYGERVLNTARNVANVWDDETLGTEHLLVATVITRHPQLTSLCQTFEVSRQQLLTEVTQLLEYDNVVLGDLVRQIESMAVAEAPQNQLSEVGRPMVDDASQALGMLGAGLGQLVNNMNRPRRQEVSLEATSTQTEYINPAVIQASKWGQMYEKIVDAMIEKATDANLDGAKIAETARKVADGFVAGIQEQLHAWDEPDTETPTKQPAFDVDDPVVRVKDWNEAGAFDIPEFVVQDRNWDAEANVWKYTIQSTDRTPEVILTVIQDELVEKTVAEVAQRESFNQAEASNQVEEKTYPGEWVKSSSGGAIGTSVYVTEPDGTIPEGQETRQVVLHRFRELDAQEALEHEYMLRDTPDQWFPSERLRTEKREAVAAGAGDESVVT